MRALTIEEPGLPTVDGVTLTEASTLTKRL